MGNRAHDDGYTSDQLAAAAEVERRTIRSWVAHGLLAPPRRRGPGARHPTESLLRVRVIAAMRAKNLALDAIRRRIAKATAEELQAMLPPPAPASTAVVAATTAVPAPSSDPATALERSAPPPVALPAQRWARVVLVPGLELHVDLSAGQALERVAQEIYRHYGPRGA